jgi:hypothetical protein
MYYKPATSSPRQEAMCADCAKDRVIGQFFGFYLTVAAVLLNVILSVIAGRRYISERSKAELWQLWTTRLERLWLAAKPLNKGKILIGERQFQPALLPGLRVLLTQWFDRGRAHQAS